VAVADQQNGCPGGASDPAGLLKPAEVASGQVRAAPGVHRGDRGLDRCLVAQRAGWDHERGLVVERDDAQIVGRFQAFDQREQRGAGAAEPPASHGAAAVEHDLQRRGNAFGVARRVGGGQLDEQGELVALLERDDVQVHACGNLHGAVLEGAVVVRAVAPPSAHH